jgi:hypothetical protein
MAASVLAAMTLPITRINSHWQHKKNAAEVIVTRVTIREVTFISLDKSFSGTVAQWLFRQDFQPVTDTKKKPPKA